MKKTLPLMLLLANLTGCLYTNIRSPRAYRSATPSEVKAQPGDETVTGQACNRYVLYLVAWGKGGYQGAVKDALGGRTDVLLYDVKTDIKVKSILFGLYAKVCTSVMGKVSRP